MAPWVFHYLNPWGSFFNYFLPTDDAFALKPRPVKKSREERIASYRWVWGNAFGILVSTVRVLLTTMDQRKKVYQRHCIVLYSSISSIKITITQTNSSKQIPNVQIPNILGFTKFLQDSKFHKVFCNHF